jgi:hypothetical protein
MGIISFLCCIVWPCQRRKTETACHDPLQASGHEIVLLRAQRGLSGQGAQSRVSGGTSSCRNTDAVWLPAVIAGLLHPGPAGQTTAGHQRYGTCLPVLPNRAPCDLASASPDYVLASVAASVPCTRVASKSCARSTVTPPALGRQRRTDCMPRYTCAVTDLHDVDAPANQRQSAPLRSG